MSDLTIRFDFVSRDLWVGLYVDRRTVIYNRKENTRKIRNRVYLCLVPTLPIMFEVVETSVWRES